MNARYQEGRTPLMAAAEHGHTAVVKYLVQHGADMHERLVVRATHPLATACLVQPGSAIAAQPPPPAGMVGFEDGADAGPRK